MTPDALFDAAEATTETLTGVVERITFQSEESGYTVAAVSVRGRCDTVTVVGNFPLPQVGETLHAQGRWITHPRYGRQFEIVRAETVVPVTPDGIRRYLNAGVIRGIGPKMAERIVDHFGTDTLTVIEKEPERLQKVPGIGAKRLAVIRADWAARQEARQTLLYMQSHGIGGAYAQKIHNHYKERAIAAVKENPYRLASEISGIGFATADQIAAKLGFQRDSPLRAESGVLFVLGQLADRGHVYFPRTALIAQCAEILQIPATIVGEALERLAIARKVVIERLSQNSGRDTSTEAIYLTHLHRFETSVATKLAALTRHRMSKRKADIDKLLEQAKRAALFLWRRHR